VFAVRAWSAAACVQKDDTMAFRPARTRYCAALGVGLALLLPAVAATGQNPDLPEQPMTIPSLPSPLEPPPAVGGQGTGMDANEAIRRYEASLREIARAVGDPALRATTLNLVARSEIVARRLDAARDDLREAAQAALSLPPGLIRDLRLMAIITNLNDLAHEEVVEAVPNNPPMPDSENPTIPFATRKKWLDKALGEWEQAAQLARQISNGTYRSERLASVVQGQAADTLKIGRDATYAATSRIDLDGQVPELLASLDEIERQAAAHAELIDRAVWSDLVLGDLAVAAARSQQFARCVSIARMIPRPVSRAQVQIRTGEELARVAADLQERFAADLRQNAAALLAELDGRATPADEAAVGASREEAAIAFQGRLQALNAAAARLQRQARTVEAFYVHEQTILRGERLLSMPIDQTLVDRARRMSDHANRLEELISNYEKGFSERLDAARAKEGREREDELAKLVPTLQDPALAEIRKQVQLASDDVEGLAEPAGQAATLAYEEAARSVAAIELTDPRSLAAHRLIESLVAVGRFDDARAATSLLSNPNRRLFVLGEIAESQGRRGLSDSARRWIEAEVPPEHRAALLRRVSQGVLTTVDQIRIQSSVIPGAGGR
jgi:hypothetical protein